MPWTFLKDVADNFVREKENWKEYFLVAGFSCPADWKYPFQCPEGLNINSNKTGACCYNNGPSCCEPGGRRCSDNGSSVRDYCPRPQDNKKLKHCCMIKGNPSCCESSGVYHEARWDDKNAWPKLSTVFYHRKWEWTLLLWFSLIGIFDVREEKCESGYERPF